jgi:ABC-type molybdenum transport system ATPase subunit/photorepair protein PhrA
VSRAVPPADAATRPPIISMAGVSVAFGAREVLRSIELAVAPGERIALVGPNGISASATWCISAICIAWNDHTTPHAER